jgi:hypothetical protein
MEMPFGIKIHPAVSCILAYLEGPAALYWWSLDRPVHMMLGGEDEMDGHRSALRRLVHDICPHHYRALLAKSAVSFFFCSHGFLGSRSIFFF